MEDIRDNIDIDMTTSGEELTPKELKKAKKTARIRSRIWELDFLRGICVMLMIWDHLMFDVGYLFGDIWFDATGNVIYQQMTNGAMAYWDSDIRMIVRPIVVMCFFLLCGISCSFSRSNFKRGAILLGFSLVLTGVTVAINEPILFGVLHMLSISILIIAVIRLVTRKNKWAYVIVSAVLGITLLVIDHFIPSMNVTPNNNLAFIASEFTDSNFVSLDYFPLLPNTGYVLIGAAVGPLLYPKRKSLLPFLDTKFRWYRPFNFFGRHAAIFYLTHQVAWALLLALFTIIAIPDGWSLIVNNFLS